MAVEVESGGQVEEFLGVLKRRLTWILVPALLITAFGSFFAVIIPKKYVVETKVLVRDTNFGGRNSVSMSAQEAMVASHQIKSLQRITEVMEKLRWPEYLELSRTDQQQFLREVRDGLKVEKPAVEKQSTQRIVSLSYAHGDPQRAFDLLVAISEAWQVEVLERGRLAEKEAFNRLKEQRGDLEKQRSTIQKSIQEERTEYRLPPPVPGMKSGSSISDQIFNSLEEDTREAEKISREIFNLELRIARAKEEHLKMDRTISKVLRGEGVDNDAQIEGLKRDIAMSREEQRGYRPAHSRYREFERAIESLLAEIAVLESAQSAPIERVEERPNEKYDELAKKIADDEATIEILRTQETRLRDSIEEETQRSIEVQEVRSRIALWEADIEIINQSLADVDELFQNQKAKLGLVEGPGGNPFDILDAPQLPTVPTEPNPLMIAIFSIFLGLGAGFGLAIVTEYSKNCFRSVSDVSRVMVAPVLGSVNRIVTRRQKRRVRLQRLLVAISTSVVVISMAYVTWAWSEDPGRLSTTLLDAIEQLRSSFS